jgi:carbonic anhydrase
MLKKLQTSPKTSLLALMAITVILSAWAWGLSTPSTNAILSSDEAIQKLKDGNARFVASKCTHPRMDAARLVETSEKGQNPFVTVITCSDSRVPVEAIFDQGIGDVFVIRVAGNVCHVDEAGSAEYGVDHLGTPLLVVLGHTGCGAVTAVATGAELHGNIPALVDSIGPAVKKAAAANPHLSGQELVPEAIKANCWQSVEDLLKTSPATRELVKAGKLKIVAAIYNIRTGTVGWLGTHPEQDRLLATATGAPEARPVAKGPSETKPAPSGAPETKPPANPAASSSQAGHATAPASSEAKSH